MTTYNRRKYKKINTGVTVVATNPILIYLSQENHNKLAQVNFPLESEIVWLEAKSLLEHAKINTKDIDEAITDKSHEGDTVVLKSEPKEKPDSYTFSPMR